jgi:hypothetical protein
MHKGRRVDTHDHARALGAGIVQPWALPGLNGVTVTPRSPPVVVSPLHLFMGVDRQKVPVGSGVASARYVLVLMERLSANLLCFSAGQWLDRN